MEVFFTPNPNFSILTYLAAFLEVTYLKALLFLFWPKPSIFLIFKILIKIMFFGAVQDYSWIR